MATPISELEIKLFADVARLRQDMDQAKGVVTSAMRDIQRAVDLAKSAMVALVGVGSAAAFAGMIRGAIDSAAALHDLAQQTGASVEMLSAMMSVAKLSDTAIDSVAGAMNKLSRNLAAVDDEGKESTRALAAIGIEAGKLAGLRTDEQMLAIAQSLSRFEDDGSKAAVAMALFGKEGAKLIPFLNDLAAAGELQAKITAEQAAMADEFGDTLTKLQTSGESWKKELAMGMLPALNDFANAMVSAMNHTGGMREEVRKLSADGSIAEWTRDALNFLTRVVDAGEGVVRVFSGITKTMAAMAAQAVALATGDLRGAMAVGDAWRADMNGLLEKPLLGERLREAFETTAAAKKQALDDYQKAIADVQAAYAGYDIGVQRAAQKALRDAYFGAEKESVDFRSKTPKKDADLAEYEKLIRAIQEKTAAQEAELNSDHKLTEAEKDYAKVLMDVTAGYLKLTPAQFANAAAVFDNYIKQSQLNVQKKEAAKLAENYAKAIQAMLGPLEEEASRLEREVETFGMTRDQIEAVTIARLEEAKAIAAANGASEEALRFYERELEARRRIMKSAADREALQQQADVWKSIESTAHQTFVSIFDSGKDAFTRLRDTLKNTVFDLLYQMTLKKWIINLSAGISGTGVAGAAFGAQGGAEGAQGGAGGSPGGLFNLASTGNSLYNMASGGGGLYSSFATSGIGQALGLSAAGVGGGMAALGALGGGVTTAAGTGLALAGGTTGLSVGAGLGSGVLAGSTLTAGTGTAIGAAAPALTTLGTVVPVIGAVFAIAAALGAFGKKVKTPKINLINADIDGWSQFDTPFGTVSGAAKHDKNFAQTFEGLKPIAQMDASLAAMLSQSEIDAVKAALAGTGTGEVKSKGNVAEDFVRSRLDIITDAVGGWINDLADTAEGELQDVYTQTAQILAARKMAGAETLATALLGEGGSEFFRESSTAAEAFARMAGALQTVNPVLERINLAAMEMTGLGGNAATDLIKKFGSAEAFTASTGAYFAQFFSESERAQIEQKRLQQIIADTFGELQMAVPPTREAFRDLVESFRSSGRLMTEEGQETFATLMQVAGAFSAVTAEADAAGKAAAAERRAFVDARRAAQAEELAVIAKAQEAAAQATADLFARIKDGIADIDAWLKGSLLGNASVLSPEQKIFEAQARFDALYRAAMGGDADAIGNLTGAAEALQQVARDGLASSPAYVAIWEDIRAKLGQVGYANSPEGRVAAQNAALEAANAAMGPDPKGRYTGPSVKEIMDATGLSGDNAAMLMGLGNATGYAMDANAWQALLATSQTQDDVIAGLRAANRSLAGDISWEVKQYPSGASGLALNMSGLGYYAQAGLTATGANHLAFQYGLSEAELYQGGDAMNKWVGGAWWNKNIPALQDNIARNPTMYPGNDGAQALQRAQTSQANNEQIASAIRQSGSVQAQSGLATVSELQQTNRLLAKLVNDRMGALA